VIEYTRVNKDFQFKTCNWCKTKNNPH